MRKQRKIPDLTGRRFTGWLVLGRDEKRRGRGIWIAQCNCGIKGFVRGDSLQSGASTQCITCAHENSRQRLAIYRRKHGMRFTRIYGCWQNMHRRCNDPKNRRFKSYGGRGISVCKEWAQFPVFAEWAIKNGYADDLTIERKDVNGGYNPANCTWANATTQAQNRRFVKRRKDGKPWCAIAKENGVRSQLFNGRVHDGWTHERAATTPKRGI